MAGRKTRLRGRAGSYITQSLRERYLKGEEKGREGRPANIVYPARREFEKGIRCEERSQVGRAEPGGRADRQARGRKLHPGRGIGRPVVLGRQTAREGNRDERRPRRGVSRELPHGRPDEQLEPDERAERVAREAEHQFVP